MIPTPPASASPAAPASSGATAIVGPVAAVGDAAPPSIATTAGTGGAGQSRAARGYKNKVRDWLQDNYAREYEDKEEEDNNTREDEEEKEDGDNIRDSIIDYSEIGRAHV